jgi:hypothetical protein
MSERYDAIAVRKYTDRDGNEKSSFTNIGVAWPMKDRDGFRVQLHAMPAPTEGEYLVLLMPPKPREDQPQQPAQQSRYSADKARRPAAQTPVFDPAPDDSDIPFSPEFR